LPGATAAFSVAAVSGYLGATTATPGPAISYQWQSAPAGSTTFTNIPNANGSSYTTPVLKAQQNGMQFQVVLTTAGASTISSIAVVTITAPLAAAFVGTPTIGAAPLTVSFTDNSTGVITNRSWNWGDGSTTNTSATALQHTYATAGTNTVALTVSGPAGINTLTQSSYIVVTNLGPVTILIERAGNQLRLLWPNGTLQTAPIVTGPYTNIAGVLSPFTVAPSNTAQFFRVQVR